MIVDRVSLGDDIPGSGPRGVHPEDTRPTHLRDLGLLWRKVGPTGYGVSDIRYHKLVVDAQVLHRRLVLILIQKRVT